MAGDWIRLHRKALDSRAFSDPWLWQLWCWCLLSANWKTGWKLGCELQPGQFATDCRGAAERLSTSKTRVHRGLHTLQEWGQIRLDVKRGFTVVTVCNWEVYQCGDDEARDAGGTLAGQTRDASGTDAGRLQGDEEGEEGKEGKKRARPPPFVRPTAEDVAAYCAEQGYSLDPAAFVDHYEANGWRVGKNPMRDWKAAVRTWEKRQAEFAQRPGRNGKPSAAEQTAQGLFDSGFFAPGGQPDDP